MVNKGLIRAAISEGGTWPGGLVGWLMIAIILGTQRRCRDQSLSPLWSPVQRL